MSALFVLQTEDKRQSFLISFTKIAGFSVFASASLLFTFLFSLREVILDRKKDLMEVIHG